MKFDRIFTGLKDLVEELVSRGEIFFSPLIDVSVTGEEQSALVASSTSQAKIGIRFLSSKRNGRDELRGVFNDGLNLFKNATFGNRILTFEILGTSYDQADDGMIYPLLENVRTRLATRSGLARIKSLGCSLAETSDIQATPGFTLDGATSEAMFLLVLNAGVYYEDVSDTTIDTVNVTFQEPT